VPDIRIVDQELRCRHDLGEPGLVVGTEQRRAVGRDDVVADLVEQRGIVADPDDPPRIAGKLDVAAAVVAHSSRPDVRSGEVGRGVHVRAEADDRHRLFDIGWNGCIDVAMFIEMPIGEADREQFLNQHAAQILLLFGRRLCR
jgi:hypothetical protein